MLAAAQLLRIILVPVALGASSGGYWQSAERPENSPALQCFGAVDRVVAKAVGDGIAPGGVIVVGGSEGVWHIQAFGTLSNRVGSGATTIDTVYDLASLSKGVATTMLAMVLVDRGLLTLDAPLSDWYAVFENGAKSAVRVRDLLTHSSGLPAWAPLYKAAGDRAGVVRLASEAELAYEPGTQWVYSDLGMILLGDIIERVGGMSLSEAAREWVWEPLGMSSTGYGAASMRERAATTGHSAWRRRDLKGEVHDENAFRMGGCAGHAGVFSTAPDLAILAQMLLNGGSRGETSIASRATVRRFTRPATPGLPRALGWAVASGDGWAGGGWSRTAFGHTGTTGTVLWVDPSQDIFLVLLTNAVASASRGEGFSLLRRRVADLALESVRSGCWTAR